MARYVVKMIIATKSNLSVVLLCGVVLGGAIAIAACSSDDTGTSTSSSSSSSGSSGASSGSSGGADDGGSSGSSGSSGDAGSSGSSGSSGDAGKTNLANGADCAGDGECKSGHCYIGGTGGGGGSTVGSCTIVCTMPSKTDPACANDPAFTGKCNGKSFCQTK